MIEKKEKKNKEQIKIYNKDNCIILRFLFAMLLRDYIILIETLS